MSELYQRNALPWARELLQHTPALVVEGARQVGKSTLAGELVRDQDAVIVTMDNESVRAQAREDPVAFVAQAGRGLLVIDEVQRLPEITLAVKAAIDADRRPGRFVLTGSASLLRVRGLADSLAGRVARLNLYGLSQGEIAGSSETFVSHLRTDHEAFTAYRTKRTREHYASLIGRGSFPELQRLPERVRLARLDDYARGIVERDLRELRQGVEPARSMAALRALAAQPAGELVKARLAHLTSIPTRTVAGYVDLLHDVGLVASLPPWTPNLAKREVGRAKSFVLDSALALRLSRLTPAQLAQFDYSEAFGSYLEAFVAAEMLKQRTWSLDQFELFHYRDRTGTEVDLVLEFEDGVVAAIEVKAASSITSAHFAGMKKLRDALGERFAAGIVVHTGPSGLRYSDRLYALPVDALWEFGGADHHEDTLRGGAG